MRWSQKHDGYRQKKVERKYVKIDKEMEDILLYHNFVIMFFFDAFLKHSEFYILYVNYVGYLMAI